MGEKWCELRRIVRRVGEAKKFLRAAGEVFVGEHRVVAIVTFAGEEQHEVARLGEAFGGAGHGLTGAAHHRFLRHSCGPGGILPLPHLRHGDDGDRHGSVFTLCSA